jgi:preprotein translocase subunit YajC
MRFLLFSLLLVLAVSAGAQEGSGQPQATQSTESASAEGSSEQEQAPVCPTGGIGGILPIVAMVAIFYFLIIRPQQKQQKRLKEMRANLAKGDSVVSSGGIYGVITNTKGNKMTVRIADGVKVDIDRDSLNRVSEEEQE